MVKHCVWLGLNPSLPDGNIKRKTAFHIPLVDNNSKLFAKEIKNKLEKNVLNKASFSTYVVQSSESSWENLIKENKYFSSIKEPTKKIDDFIDNLNNVRVNAVDVAKYILRQEEHCTSLRLQKLLYLVYANYLKKYNHPLFDQPFYAWEYGPVNLDVFKSFDKNANTNEIELLNKSENDKDKLIKSVEFDDSYKKVFLHSGQCYLYEFIQEIINKYKATPTWDLVDMLHKKGSAWSKTNKNEIITNETIKSSII